MELTIVGHALDCCDHRILGLDSEHGARLDGLSVQVDRASAAIAGLAANVGSSESQMFPDQVDQESAGLDIGRDSSPVHRHGHFHL
jgi:hypothetical protein